MSVRPIQFVRELLTGRRGRGCRSCPMAAPTTTRKVLLFGAPNVGKSMVFNQLTGSYAVVSNYPGTTVEVSRGQTRTGDSILEVVDSPGSYALLPYSEDERVARDLLLDERPDVVVHVVEAKNLPRMLPLTLQLAEAGLPLVLDVNIIDEAERAGLSLDVHALGRELGIPVVATAAASGLGMDRLRSALAEPPPARFETPIAYPEPIARAMERIAGLLHADYGISGPAVALLLLQRDGDIRDRIAARDGDALTQADRLVSEVEAQYAQPPALLIALARQQAADRIVGKALVERPRPLRAGFAEWLGAVSIHPLAGIPILLAVLYFGIYLVVGRLGAGLLVGLLDKRLFAEHVNPWATDLVARLLPAQLWSRLFVGDYGVITLGLRYALAIVLPLVAMFFLVFAVLEDSGYLPRLALMVDRLFKRIGLSGRAAIPIVLGLGCDTMATLVTRILETRRERVIATFLLALAIPCSAQLGVILGLLSAHPAALAIWAGVVLGVFLLSGFLAAQLLPGEAPRFYLEIPPLRIPSLRNVLVKTLARLRWYAAEVIPLFLLASVIIWIGQLTHLFDLAVAAMRPVVGLIGLPRETADAFLFGFFRRDYGAARIFDVHASGAISGIPLVVAMVTITLFIPCIAQFLVMQKERGLRTALAVSAVIVPFAFGVGYLLNLALTTLRVTI